MTDRQPMDSGRIYLVTQLLPSLTTAAQEMISLVASTLARVEILRLELGQLTSSPIPMSIETWRNSTGGSTGGTLPSVNREGWPTAPAAVATVTGQSTTLNSTSTATQNVVRLQADTFEIDSGQYTYQPEFPPIIDYSQRYSARISPLTTAAVVGMAVTLTFRETGKIL